MDFDWAANIKSYQNEKRGLNSVRIEKPIIVRSSMIKSAEVAFNPVTQTFRSPVLENNLKTIEHLNLIDRLAAGKDRNLRYEQTFDFINRRDKLKNFSDHPLYPKIKSDFPKKTKKVLESQIFCLNGHELAKQQEKQTIPERLVRSIEYKDFDIISNRYNENHEEKQRIDKEVNYLESAKRLVEMRPYDVVKNAYINDRFREEREMKDRYLRDSMEKRKFNQLPVSVREKGLLYNPVNNEVKEKDRLDMYDRREKAKKARFTAKNIHEETNKARNVDWDEKVRRSCHDKQRADLKGREFDLVSLEKNEKFERELNSWDRIMKGKKVEIFKPKKSVEDRSDELKKFIDERRIEIKKLPEMSQERRKERMLENYKRTPEITRIDKGNFFGTMKKVNAF